jgi:uncharacterized protein (UPF0332 family)
MTNEERDAAVELRIAKAYRAYEEAKGVVALKYWETIANRLYYAAFNAVTALLIANGDTAQTHSGVRHILGLKFIKAGILPHETGRLYHRLFSMRQTGDYDDTYDVTAEDVLPNLEPTGKLIDVIAAKARELIGK